MQKNILTIFVDVLSVILFVFSSIQVGLHALITQATFDWIVLGFTALLSLDVALRLLVKGQEIPLPPVNSPK